MRGGSRRDSQLRGAHVVCAPLVQTDFGFRGAGRTKAWATSAWQPARLASESQGVPNTMPAWPAAPPEGTAARRFPDAPFRSPGSRCCSSGISVGVGLPNMVGQRPLCVNHQSPLGLATLHYSSRSGPSLHASWLVESVTCLALLLALACGRMGTSLVSLAAGGGGGWRSSGQRVRARDLQASCAACGQTPSISAGAHTSFGQPATGQARN